MLAALIDHCGHCSIIEIVEPAADQRKTLRSQVHHSRREIQFAIEPEIHSVLISREHVRQMVGHHRTQVARDNLLGQHGLLNRFSRNRRGIRPSHIKARAGARSKQKQAIGSIN